MAELSIHNLKVWGSNLGAGSGREKESEKKMSFHVRIYLLYDNNLDQLSIFPSMKLSTL